ncbi:MAG: hypothetical protein IT288_15515 [Bdellovibrionales bacterium]|nr:hypothetical protein [Bdellovibrionales bacterium]
MKYSREVPASVRQTIDADLNLLYSLELSGQTPLHSEIFGQARGTTYKRFFEKYVQEIGFHDCGGGSSVACAFPGSDPRKIFLTPHYLSSPKSSSVTRLSSLFHETRHLDSNFANWPHELCPTPFLDEQGKDIIGIVSGLKMEGLEACDWSVYGSYAHHITAIMFYNMARFCSNCNREFRAKAEELGLDQMRRVINSSGIKAQEAIRADFESSPVR